MSAAEGRRGTKGHWVGVGAILFIGWLFLLLGLVGVYMHRTLYNEAVFTKRVTAVLEQPGVQNAVATEMTDTIIDRKSTRLNSSHVKRSRMPSSA